VVIAARQTSAAQHAQMSLDGGCDGRNVRARGDGVAVGTALPANLMDFTDDLLAAMFRPLAMEHGALAVEHVPLAFFVSVKLVSRRMMSLMQTARRVSSRSPCACVPCSRNPHSVWRSQCAAGAITCGLGRDVEYF